MKTITINVPDTFTVTCGIAGSFDIDFDRLVRQCAWEAVAHAMHKGFDNLLLDAGANETKEAYTVDNVYDEAKHRAGKRAIIEKKLERIYANDVRAVGKTRIAADPVGDEAARIARVDIGLAVKKDETLLARLAAKLGLATDAERKEIMAAAVAERAKRPEIVERARKNVAELAAIPAELDDLI